MKKACLISIIFLFTIFGYAVELDIYFTGKTFGTIAPCDCPLHPDGGISRRVKYFSEINSNDNLFLDTGGILSGGYGEWLNTSVGEERNNILKEGYKRINYSVIVPGLSEFQYPLLYLKEIITTLNYNFVCANYIGKEKIFKQYIVKKIKGQRILIIGVTDKEHTNFKLSKDFNDSDFIDPKKAVKNILKLHKKSGDLVIVLGFLSEKKIKEIIDYNPRVNLVLHGKNEILLKKPYIYGKTLIAQSYFNSKKIGKISLKFVRNRIVNWNFKYDRLSPSVGELADIFNRTYKLLGDTEARKRYNVYLIFDKFLPNKNEKEIIKFLKKNNIQYKALFENLDSKNVNEVELINEHSDKFVSSQYYPQEETTEKIIYKNQREITNFGKNDLKPCIFTGLRYFYLDDLTIKDIRWDLQILGLIK